MRQLFTNNFSTTTVGSITTSSTSITLTNGSLAASPVVSMNEYQLLTLQDASGNMEVVKMTARSGNVITVTRGYEGTAFAWPSGSVIEARATATTFKNLLSSDFTGISSPVVTDTSTYVYTVGGGSIFLGNTVNPRDNDITVGTNSIILGNTNGNSYIGNNTVYIGTKTSVGTVITGGNNSVVIGNGSSNNNDNSVAIKSVINRAPAGNTVAIGGTINYDIFGSPTTIMTVLGGTAINFNPVVISSGTNSSNSVIIGSDFSGTGYNNTFIGASSTCLSNNPYISVVGSSNTINSTASSISVIGSSNTVGGQNVVVTGGLNTSTGNNDITIGTSHSNTHARSILIGDGLTSGADDTVCLKGISLVPNVAVTSLFNNKNTRVDIAVFTQNLLSTSLNTVGFKFFADLVMTTNYANYMFVLTELGLVIMSGSITTAPTFTVAGNVGSQVLIPDTAYCNSTKGDNTSQTITVIDNGGGTIVSSVTAAGTGTYTARLFVKGFLLRK